MTSPDASPPSTVDAVHHIELWTHDLAEAAPSFHWLLTTLGWQDTSDPAWTAGRTWQAPTGVYLVLEQSPHVVSTEHDRLRPGLNHLALRIADRALLDVVRARAAVHGWSELFADAYPHAGGEAHTALFLANSQGFEVEIVAGA